MNVGKVVRACKSTASGVTSANHVTQLPLCATYILEHFVFLFQPGVLVIGELVSILKGFFQVLQPSFQPADGAILFFTARSHFLDPLLQRSGGTAGCTEALSEITLQNTDEGGEPFSTETDVS